MAGRHYLDHASSSPLRPEAVEALCAWAREGAHADPGRPYAEGRQASAAIEEARESLAELLGVRARQVVFTSGGTEAANWVNAAARAGAPGAPIALAPVEHAAVRRSAERSGPVAWLAVDRLGRVDLDSVAQVLERDAPSLVHCQYANHEVGTLQPVEEVVAACRRAGVRVHVDACAAVGQLPVDLGALGADFVSLSAHKLGGPPGVGALVIRRGQRLAPLLVGPDQERGRRAGTENAGGIVAFGAVARALAAPGALEAAAARARRQADALLAAALEVPGVSCLGDPERRVPHLACVQVAGVEAEGVVLGLDQSGVAVHSGSACSSEAFEPSPVLQAMGVDAQRSLRVSVGWSTTEADVSAFAEAFPAVVRSLRELGQRLA
ncbi:MAG TPA: cysteine desulfurase family protein [Acidimicrobiales bacterium]|nr:cysteine desulfurase family protein [Acidimicrobiales bacterium]